MNKILSFFKEFFLRKHTFGAVRSSAWQETRRRFLAKHPFCEVCNATEGLEVHHKKPFHLFPTLELYEGNLITLCENHHLLIGHLGSWRSYNDEIDADAAIWHVKISKRP